jgi:hypothetical protein
MFSRRSLCRTFTLHPRMAAYTCSSTHANGTGGRLVKTVSPARVELLSALNPVSGELSKMVPLTIVPYETAGYLLTIGAYVLVFLLARSLSSSVDMGNWTMIWSLLVVGAAEAALGCFRAFTTGWRWDCHRDLHQPGSLSRPARSGLAF